MNTQQNVILARSEREYLRLIERKLKTGAGYLIWREEDWLRVKRIFASKEGE